RSGGGCQRMTRSRRSPSAPMATCSRAACRAASGSGSADLLNRRSVPVGPVMHPLIRCLLVLLGGLVACWAALAQDGPKDQQLYELRFIQWQSKARYQPNTHATALAFGLSKDRPVIFFGSCYPELGHDGVWRWDLGKPGSKDLTNIGTDLTKLPVVKS